MYTDSDSVPTTDLVLQLHWYYCASCKFASSAKSSQKQFTLASGGSEHVAIASYWASKTKFQFVCKLCWFYSHNRIVAIAIKFYCMSNTQDPLVPIPLSVT